MKRYHLAFVVAVTAAADFLPPTYAGFTTSGGTTGPAPAKTGETARNADVRACNNARRITDDANSKCRIGIISASSSPLFRSAPALFNGNGNRMSSAAAAAAVVAATANTSKGINTRSKFDDRNSTAIFQVMVQRIAQFKSSLAVTCNAAVAFLAAQYLGAILLFGVASSSLSSSSAAPLGAVGHSYHGNLPPMGPVAAVMRVAPAGATSSVASACPTASVPGTTSRDVLRLCTGADTVKMVAGVSAAVAGATLGRKFFYEHIGNKVAEDEQKTEEDGRTNSTDASIPPAAPAIRSSISSSAEPRPTSMTREVLKNALPSTSTVIDESGCCESQADRSFASKILDDRGSAQRDFTRMRNLLEARLQLEASERKKAHAEQDRELFQRRLLAARIKQDAADRALRIRQEKEKVRANTITPELMSTIKMLSEQEESDAPTCESNTNHSCADDAAGGLGALNTSAGSTFLPVRRKGFRSALASVSALFSSVCE